MTGTQKKADFKTYYRYLVRQHTRNALLTAAAVILFFTFVGYYTRNLVPVMLLALVSLLLTYLLHRHYTRGYRRRLALADAPFPEAWQTFLQNSSAFYRHLGPEEQQLFNQRVLFFLAEKKIEGISTPVDDHVRLLVAASAIIPTFAFPFFEYPNLDQVLLYPNSFDHSFQTTRYDGHQQDIAGMVGSGFLNGTLLLSRPDLEEGFQGRSAHNVGIHEFVHLLDMADGAVDGLPEIFLANTYAIPWLQVIREEVQKIRQGESDIDPYGLTSNAEFLAVVSEYFFDDPAKLEAAHPELYRLLCAIFHQTPGKRKW